MSVFMEIKKVKLRVNYTIPVEPGDEATLLIDLDTNAEPFLHNFEMKLFSKDAGSKMIASTTSSLGGIAPVPQLHWSVAVSKLDEDKGSRDEIFVEVRKSGGGIAQPGKWCRSDNVNGFFGTSDKPPNA